MASALTEPVLIEIETAIRNLSWASFQAGQKSLQKIIVDFSSKKVEQDFTTGETDLGVVSLRSVRDDFKLSKVKFDGSNNVTFSASGQTASKALLVVAINYSFNILLTRSPRLVTVTGAHDGYPSYNIAVNGKSVYDHVQGFLGELAGDSDVKVNRKSVPW